MSPKQITTSLVIILALILGISFLSGQVKKTINESRNISLKENNPVVNNIFSLPNFYLDSQGKPQPIQTEIVKSTDPKYGYMNTTNNFKTYFPKKLDTSNSVKFETNDASINFSIISQLTIKKIDNNKETIVAQKSVGELNQTTGQIDINNKNIFSYPKIYQNADKFIDIIYTIHNYKLSEEIVLNKFQDFPELTQNLVLHNAYAKVEGQNINFYHKNTNKLLWFISPPSMYEQNNRSKTSFGLYYDLKCSDSNTTIEKCSNLLLTKKFTNDGQKWLSDPSRKYPIVIDPVINDADSLTNWATSDSTNFNIALDTGVTKETTGSIRITAIGNVNCWGTAPNVCDAGCNNNSYGSPTVYATCSSTTSCNTGWYYSGQPCSYTTFTPQWSGDGAWTGCDGSCGTGSLYGSANAPSGACSGDGSGSCKYCAQFITGYQDSYMCSPNPCGSPAYVCVSASNPACTWTSQTQYLAGSSSTKYTLSGSACAAAPSGSCYKANGSTSSYYTGNGSCGGGANCGTGNYYSNLPTTCTGTTSPDNSLNDTVTLSTGATDISTMGSLTFWVYSTGRTGSFMQFAFGEIGTTEQSTNFSIGSSKVWEQKTWDISGIAAASRNAVTKFTFKNTNSNVGFTFYFDLIESVAGSPNPPSGCLIRETPNDSSLTPFWTDNSSDENGFQIEKNTNSGGFSFLTNVGAGITVYVDSSVSSGNTYGYRIRSYTNGTGTTVFSTTYLDCPTLDLHTGSLKFEGIKTEGVKIY